MMKAHKFLIAALILLLALTLAACGGEKAPAETPSEAPAEAPAATQPAASQPAATPAEPTPTPEPPTPTPEPPTPTPEPEEAFMGEFTPITEKVNSYRSRGKISYVVAGVPDGAPLENTDITMEFTESWVRADNDYGFNRSMTLSGFQIRTPGEEAQGETPADFQVIELDDTTYINFGEQWISMAREENATPDDFVQVEDFISDLDEMKRVGIETMNGIETVHYAFSRVHSFESVLEGLFQREGLQGNVKSKLKQTEIKGDLWIAREGGYPVKFEMTAHAELDITLTTPEGEEKTFPITMDYEASTEYYDINADFTIEPPEGAPAPGQVDVPGFEPGTFPMPEDTTVLSSFGGIITLQSNLSVEEVTAFYEQALTDLGWTKGEGFMPTWTKDEHSFTMIITGNDDGTTSIVIMPNQ
jgi:predicted small lipoprotein YifL